MTTPKFPKLIDYDRLKAQYGQCSKLTSVNETNHEHGTKPDHLDEDRQQKGLSGARLRAYAFALLLRKEYSKADLIEKLTLNASNHDEVIALVEELSQKNYQSDQRVADTVLSSQKRKGKGPRQIKMALKTKKVDQQLIEEDLKKINWLEQAYQLKVKKFGEAVVQDPKHKAKQIRFLMYRGFDMDVILKAIHRKQDDNFTL